MNEFVYGFRRFLLVIIVLMVIVIIVCFISFCFSSVCLSIKNRCDEVWIDLTDFDKIVYEEPREQNKSWLVYVSARYNAKYTFRDVISHIKYDYPLGYLEFDHYPEKGDIENHVDTSVAHGFKAYVDDFGIVATSNLINLFTRNRVGYLFLLIAYPILTVILAFIRWVLLRLI